MIRLPFHFPLSRTIKSYVQGRVNAAFFDLEGWRFSTLRANMLVGEVSDWQLHYRPIDLTDKTVLDVGAGEGETAKFFLHCGAKRVIAVEPDASCFKNLRVNASKFSISPRCRPFQVEDLFIPNVDFAKVDIEGYEECLLGVKPPIPVVVEIHGLQLRDRFAAAGWRVDRVGFSPYAICFGYWGC